MQMKTSWPSLRVLGALLAFLALAYWFSFDLSIWLVALLSFAALREYLSLADLRPEDRWGMLAAYLSIPLVFYLVQIDWYGLFIISIPVYVFLVVPFLVTAGARESRGSVFSIGAIDFGIFLFVYCLGHLAYLARISVSLGLFLVLGVAVCDLVDRQIARFGRSPVLKFVAGLPLVLLLSFILGAQAGLPLVHRISLGVLLPVLVLMGNSTLTVVEEDLGIDAEHLEPGRGRMIDGLRAQLFAAPVVFHYVRYFTELL